MPSSMKGSEVLLCSLDSFQHDALAVSFAPFGRYDSADGDFTHVRPGRTDPAYCDHFLSVLQP